MQEDLKIIKDKYGEKMMHLCRSLFPIILEEPLALSTILLNNFEPFRFLYDDIINEDKVNDFKNYIYRIYDKKRIDKVDVEKTPSELLDEAGYILYECKTEEEIQYFKRYYSKDEELCTFKGGRLNNCYVFFAVKKDVDRIKRKNFKNPERQDEYGTSVISIQFTKDESHTLSIKNRYNHRVINPDATFSNNLDNIIPGLADSFEKFNGMKQQHKHDILELDDYVKANDGKYYKYNHEINNIYYCPNNIIIDNFEVKRYPKEKYIVIENFVLDLTTKTISLYDTQEQDSFVESIGKIKKIDIIKDGKIKKLIIAPIEGEMIIIKLNEKNEIVGLENPNIKEIGDDFAKYNREIREIDFPQLEKVGNNFLSFNEKLEKITFPQLKIVQDDFIKYNIRIREVDFPQLEKVGSSFLSRNALLQKLSILKLKEVGDYFVINNSRIETINFPQLEKIGTSFLGYNMELKEINFPQLEIIKNDFMYYNEKLEKINMPNLKTIGYRFFYHHPKFKTMKPFQIRKISIAQNSSNTNSNKKYKISNLIRNLEKLLKINIQHKNFNVKEEENEKINNR